MKRAVIIYKGIDDKINYCNLDADGLVHNENGQIEVWKGENEFVGVFATQSLIAAYISDKKETDR